MVIVMRQPALVIGLLLSLLQSVLPAEKLTQVGYCPDKRNENAQVSRPNPWIQQVIESAFPANKDILVEGLITNNFTKVRQSISGSEGKYVLHIAIISIFALLLLILIPVLLFTKFCLCCTPCQKKNKRHQQEGYNKCQLQWPAIATLTLLVFLLSICAASKKFVIIVLKMNQDFEHRYADFNCSLSLITRDLLEGVDYTKDDIRFLGLRNYNKTMNNFYANLKDVYGHVRFHLASLSKPIRNTIKSLSFLNSSVASLPNGPRAQKQYLILTYSPSFIVQNQTNRERVNSTFVDVLGNPLIANSLLYNFSVSVINTNSSVSQVSNMSDALMANLSKIQEKRQIVQNSINSQISMIEQIKQDTDTTMDIVEVNILRTYIVGSYVVISFCIVAIVGLAIVTLWLLLKKKYLCRFGVYFCCALLWLIGLLFFSIGIAFVLSNPGALYSCQYLRESLESQQKFHKNIVTFKSDIGSLQIISKCLSNSTTPSYFYKSIIDPSITKLMLEIRAYLMFKYEGVNRTAYLNGTYQQLQSSIIQYRSGEILDLNTPSMIDELKSISKTEGCFPDSWVPSLRMKEPQIPCQLGPNSPQADIYSCQSIDDFIARVEGCIGCIDASSIITLFNANDIGDKLKQYLSKRYENCTDENGKKTLVSNLNEILGRYYFEKDLSMKQIEKSVKSLSANLRASVNALNKLINPSYKRVIEWISTQELLKVAPNSTVQMSMNCKVIGKGIQSALGILCNSGILYVYTLRFLYPTAAVLILCICGLSIYFVFHQETQRKFQKKKNLEKQIKNNDQGNQAKAQSNQNVGQQRQSQHVQGSQRKMQLEKKAEENEDIIIIDDQIENNQQQPVPPSAERLSRQAKYFHNKA